MKKILSLLLAGVLFLLCGCAAGKGSVSVDKNGIKRFAPISEIDPCVVEPDEREVMDEADRDAFRSLMGAVLDRKDGVRLSVGEDRAEFIADLLKQSPYFYFLKDIEVDGTAVSFSYAYSEEKQEEMRELIDSETLKIANSEADEDDNELDVILKIYHAVGKRLLYDEQREDNKLLGSPLFDYPADEVYKAYSEGKALCYGFAYIMRYALLQRGIDCFCVYGECRAHDMGHEWIVFEYDGEYFNCDPSWDRAHGGYCKLMHFGKTDGERTADTLAPRDFEEYHEKEYGMVECTDGRFSIFRGIVRFAYAAEHRYYLEDKDGNVYFFDSEKFLLVRS